MGKGICQVIKFPNYTTSIRYFAVATLLQSLLIRDNDCLLKCTRTLKDYLNNNEYKGKSLSVYFEAMMHFNFLLYRRVFSIRELNAKDNFYVHIRKCLLVLKQKAW